MTTRTLELVVVVVSEQSDLGGAHTQIFRLLISGRLEHLSSRSHHRSTVNPELTPLTIITGIMSVSALTNITFFVVPSVAADCRLYL